MLQTPAPLTDPLADALVRTSRGDRAAFEELYRRTSAKLFGICLRISFDRAEAEEALQEIYMAVWQRAASFSPERGRAMTWLMTVARNGAIDHLRRRRVVATLDIDEAGSVPDEAPLASERAEQAGEEHRLNRCMEELAADETRLLRAAFFQGSSYSELAVRASLPLGTVKSRIRRALLKLRDCLA